MALFGDDQYQWRETYFVLFHHDRRPSAEAVTRALQEDPRFVVSDVRADEGGQFESLTLKSPDDFSGMDVSYVQGEEVTEQIEDVLREMAKMTLTDEERAKLDRLGDCDSRLDVYHFEQVPYGEDDEEEFLDPGGLLIVLERLAALCQGVGIDPQSGTLMS